MTTYAIKADTQNLSKSFIYFEDLNLSYSEAKDKLNQFQNKFNEMIKNNITPVIHDDRNRACKVTKLSIVVSGIK